MPARFGSDWKIVAVLQREAGSFELVKVNVCRLLSETADEL